MGRALPFWLVPPAGFEPVPWSATFELFESTTLQHQSRSLATGVSRWISRSPALGRSARNATRIFPLRRCKRLCDFDSRSLGHRALDRGVLSSQERQRARRCEYPRNRGVPIGRLRIVTCGAGRSCSNRRQKTKRVLEVAKMLPTSSLPRLSCPYTWPDTHTIGRFRKRQRPATTVLGTVVRLEGSAKPESRMRRSGGCFRGGRGTRTHKPLRATVFKL